MEEIQAQIEGNSCVLKLTGMLNRRLSTLMREEMARQSMRAGIHNIILDLTDVPRMDSMGVGMLVSAFRSCQARRLQFALVGLSDRASEILRITGLDSVLPIHPTVEAAREAFAAPSPRPQ